MFARVDTKIARKYVSKFPWNLRAFRTIGTRSNKRIRKKRKGIAGGEVLLSWRRAEKGERVRGETADRAVLQIALIDNYRLERER